MKKLEILKWFVNILVLTLIEECVSKSILVEANLFLAITLQSHLIIRAILYVASIIRSKLKIEVESKNFYWKTRLLGARPGALLRVCNLKWLRKNFIWGIWRT